LPRLSSLLCLSVMSSYLPLREVLVVFAKPLGPRSALGVRGNGFTRFKPPPGRRPEETSDYQRALQIPRFVHSMMLDLDVGIQIINAQRILRGVHLVQQPLAKLNPFRRTY